MRNSIPTSRAVSSVSDGDTPDSPPAAIYNRVSTISQDASKAVADLRSAARQRGFEVALEVAETGSGARNDRPGLQDVIAAARKGQIRAVIVSRLDRFGRSSLDLLANIKAVTDAGAEFIAVEQGLHVRPRGDAMSQLLLTILAAVAEFEREIIRDRVIEGQRRAKERGVILGGPRKNIDADAVRALRAEGKSWKAIAKELGSSTATVRRRAGVL